MNDDDDLLEQKALQRLFNAGALKSVSVYRVLMKGHKSLYWLTFHAKDKEAGAFGRYSLRAQRKSPYENEIGNRYFHSIDAAVATAERIGFKEVEIKLEIEREFTDHQF